MKRYYGIAGLAVLALAVAFAAPQLFAGDEHDHSAAGGDQMKAWMEMMAPDDHHKELAKFEGVWTAKTKVWMQPGTEPMMSEGKAVNRMVMNGRFLMMDYEGNMMGMPFKGVGMNGFDKASKMYQSTWIDDMSTAITLYQGTVDESGKMIMMAKMTDPMTGGTKISKSISWFENDTTHHFEMYEAGEDGKEKKIMEIVYTRTGDAPAYSKASN